MASTTSVILSQPNTIGCPKCGNNIAHPQLEGLESAQAHIAELESQIEILTLRATSAVDKANEYEASLRRLSATRANASLEPSANPPSTSLTPAPGQSALRPSSLGSGLATAPNASSSWPSRANTINAAASASSRLARLLPLTRSASHATAPGPTTAPLQRSQSHQLSPSPSAAGPATAALPQPLSESSLLDALNHEQSLRLAAENAAARTNSEIEELTGQLFEQANEMVATERKARAKLEERVEMLEKRDGEKTRRLGLLEKRILRVERVRGLLEREKEIAKEGGGQDSPGNSQPQPGSSTVG